MCSYEHILRQVVGRSEIKFYEVQPCKIYLVGFNLRPSLLSPEQRQGEDIGLIFEGRG